MSTTRLMALHTGKGRSFGTAIRDIIDYAENPKKTALSMTPTLKACGRNMLIGAGRQLPLLSCVSRFSLFHATLTKCFHPFVLVVNMYQERTIARMHFPNEFLHVIPSLGRNQRAVRRWTYM